MIVQMPGTTPVERTIQPVERSSAGRLEIAPMVSVGSQ